VWKEREKRAKTGDKIQKIKDIASGKAIVDNFFRKSEDLT
jgi:hypothetical protein